HREPREVLLGVERHVAPRFAARWEQPLLDVEVDRLAIEAGRFAEVFHLVLEDRAIDFVLGVELHHGTSTRHGDVGWATQASTWPAAASAGRRQFGSSIATVPSTRRTLHAPQPPIA